MMHTMELLERIERVDPPPFLLTRIEARIASLSLEHLPPGRVRALALSAMLVLVLNAFVLMSSGLYEDEVTGHDRADQPGLITDHRLYP